MPNVFQWSGFYIGGYLGGGWGDADWGLGIKPSTNGFLSGGQLGVNYQTGPVVFGFGTTFTGMAVKGSVTDAFNNRYSTTVDWASAFTVRVGYTVDRFLAYGMAGLAVV